MKFREIFEDYDDEDDFTPPELPETVLPAGTVVYHGTGAKFSNSDGLESPCWVTTSYEVAKRFVDWHQHSPKGKRRVLQYVTTRPLTLLQIDDRETMDNLEEYYGVDVRDPHEMAQGVLGLRSKDGRRFDGWMIAGNYRDGDDIMLGDSGVLNFVKTRSLKEAHHEHDKLDYKTQFAPLKKGDTVRVFHGFHDVSEALTAAKHGLSGAEKADRRYSYEFSNNPKGLFVTMSLDVAKEFTSKVIMEFVAREDQLEAPVWPGGGYTVQGQAEQWFSHGAKGRAERAAKRREMQNVVKGYVEKDPEYLSHVGNSDDHYKAFMLMTGREYQALYIGHLDPSAISAFWVSDDFRKDGKYSNWTRMTVDQFVERFDETDGKNIKSTKTRRVFSPNEEFDPEKFKQAMSKMRQNPDDLFQGVVDHYLTDGTPRQKIEQFQHVMEYYLWPKQLVPALRWILKTYSKKNGITESINKKQWVYYHGTKSAPFDQFNPSAAAKGEQYWNPLGNGMYATNNPTFAGQFGGNVYKVIIPPGCNYKRFTHQMWCYTGFGLIMKALKAAFKAAKKPMPNDPFRFRVEVSRQLRSSSPYEGLYECSHLVLMDFGEDIYHHFCEALPVITTRHFKKFDFVVFTDTNDPIGMWDEKQQRNVGSHEIVIFNPNLQKTVA